MNWLDQKPHQTAQQQKTFTTYLGDGPDLSQDEIDQYNLYVSSMHMHTTSGHDDGVVDPDVKMDQAEQIDLDFIIMSSHTYGMNQGSDWTTLKDGAFFMKKRAEDKGYHCICIVGSEVSGGWAHLFTFPYTEADEGRMPRSDTAAHFAEDVATIRADHDLFVGWAHPQLMYDEAFPPQSIIDWIANGSLPCDAIEMTTYAFAGSLYTQYPTYGPSDAHTYENLNNTLTYFFAKSRSEADLIDALRNRQTVALHRFNNTIYNNDPYQLCGRFAGDRVWVDELYRRIEESRTTLNMVQDEIDVKIAEGVDMTEALTKMNLAWRAFNQLSPSKAKSIAESIFAEPEEKSEKNPSWTVWIFLMSFLVLTWFNNKKNRR